MTKSSITHSTEENNNRVRKITAFFIFMIVILIFFCAIVFLTGRMTVRTNEASTLISQQL